jgi:5-methylcytosine-specific restriction endonuclease McrA
MDTPVGQKTCPKCGRVLPATPQADLHKIAAHQRSCREAKPPAFWRGYRRYYRDSRETILGRLRHRSATQVEAGYVAFGAQMRKRGDPRHQAGGWHTSEDVERLYDEQGGCCFYCGKKLNAEYDLDHKIPLSRGVPYS